MRLPIDTTDLTLIAGEVEPVVDFETKKPKADANGEPIYSVDVVAFGEEGPQIWPVKVPGQPKGIKEGETVKVTGLVAIPWSMETRHGISFRAEAVTAQASTAAKAA